MSHPESDRASSTMSNNIERQNEVSVVSNLQPTAPEYIPSNTRSKTGAVKKNFTKHNQNINRNKMSKSRFDETSNKDLDELSTTSYNSASASFKKSHDKKFRNDRNTYYKYNGYQDKNQDRRSNNHDQESNDNNYVMGENMGFSNKKYDFGHKFDKKDRYNQSYLKHDRFSQRSNYRVSL